MVSGGDMMEGIYFYWFLWIGWVYSTFIMAKSNLRTAISFVILLLIITGNYTLQLADYSVRVNFLLLFFISLILMSKSKGFVLLYHFLCSFIISIGFVVFHLFELFDPVWLIIDQKWMLGIILLYLVLMLVKGLYYRISIGIISICNGEILYSFIMNKFSFPVEVGDFSFLDQWAIFMVLIVLWSLVEKTALYFEGNFQKGNAGRVHK